MTDKKTIAKFQNKEINPKHFMLSFRMQNTAECVKCKSYNKKRCFENECYFIKKYK